MGSGCAHVRVPAEIDVSGAVETPYEPTSVTFLVSGKVIRARILLAIGSVILVTIILLPIRVAVIAATAITVTVAATLAVLMRL